MGVRGSGGVGGGVPRARPSHVAYYVALGGILALLTLLLLYFFYFFINKVKKLSSIETPTQTTSSSCRPPPAAVTAAYPVQPVVRDSASEMAKLCKQVPAGKGGTVFPTSTSPAAVHTDTGDDQLPGPRAGGLLAPPGSAPPAAHEAPTDTSEPPVPALPTVPGVPGDPALMKPPPPVSITVPVPTLATH
ncbi:uncharacterized protein LOC142983232 [Anticarsia gemmatalis]|uniref:uncharacterized protein LOC142983232 n=1 Tax=Anticarsia gemmatalis TaxID=129554 RepID=UPI003F763D06